MFAFVFASGECFGICRYLNAAFTHGWVYRRLRSGTRLSAVSLRFLSQSGGRGGDARGEVGGVTLLPKIVLSAGEPSHSQPLAPTVEPQVNISD